MDEKKCENCAHYIQHYVKSKTRFRSIAHGHCGKPMANGRYRYTAKPCEMWEDFEMRTDDRVSHIKNTLRRMAKQINEFLEVLKDDCEE